MSRLIGGSARRLARRRLSLVPQSRRRALMVAVGAGAERLLVLSGVPERFGSPQGKTGTPELPETAGAVRQRIRGRVVVLGVTIAAVSPMLAVVVVLAGWNLPHIVDRQTKRRRDDIVADQLLLAIDLLAISVRAGSTIGRALDVVATRVPDPVGTALGDVGRSTTMGVRFDRAVSELGDRLGPTAAPLIGVIRAAHLDGDPLAPALERLGSTMRETRRHHHESEARRLSVQLLLPLVACLLPAFALISIVPVLVDSLSRMPR